jgi:hypothetical protein
VNFRVAEPIQEREEEEEEKMSMARKLVKTADSPSLWNYSLSPGWTQETSEILRLAIIKFGCGNWKAIIESKCLPGKTRSQLNLQTQRMVGQQSIAQFKGIHLDTRVVWKDVQERYAPPPPQSCFPFLFFHNFLFGKFISFLFSACACRAVCVVSCRT